VPRPYLRWWSVWSFCVVPTAETYTRTYSYTIGPPWWWQWYQRARDGLPMGFNQDQWYDRDRDVCEYKKKKIMIIIIIKYLHGWRFVPTNRIHTAEIQSTREPSPAVCPPTVASIWVQLKYYYNAHAWLDNFDNFDLDKNWIRQFRYADPPRVDRVKCSANIMNLIPIRRLSIAARQHYVYRSNIILYNSTMIELMNIFM